MRAAHMGLAQLSKFAPCKYLDILLGFCVSIMWSRSSLCSQGPSSGGWLSQPRKWQPPHLSLQTVMHKEPRLQVKMTASGQIPRAFQSVNCGWECQCITSCICRTCLAPNVPTILAGLLPIVHLRAACPVSITGHKRYDSRSSCLPSS